MIGHFPTPYPDELLYSTCARFSERLQYPNKKSVLRELFGTDTCVAVVDLPSHLDHLVKSMPTNSRYSVQELIDRHTMLPYYAPFLSPITVERLRRQMKGSHGSSVHNRCGVMASRVRPFQWLRYCPECTREDRGLFGEAYWHRIHQAPGVEVCHKHNAFLVDSAVRIHNAQSRHVFFSAECAAGSTPARSLDEKDSNRILLTISRNVAWLLECPTRQPNLPPIRARYRLLADRSLATYSGRVHAEALLKQFDKQYPQPMLSQLTSLSDDYLRGTPTWLLNIVRSTRRAKDPLQHLLLMCFLNITAEEFFSSSIEIQHFSQSPYPCLNRTAAHFRERRIKQCRITFTKDHGKPVGTFHCDCGFIYRRTGPDRSSKDQLRIDRMVEFGDVWTNALKRMWCHPDVSLRLMSRRLGVDPLTVKRQATRANLPFPRTAPRLGRMQHTRVRAPFAADKPATMKLPAYREKWLSVMVGNLGAGITELRRLIPGTYAWLRRNDAEWLKANVPSTKRARSAISRRVDWKQRDQQLAAAARAAFFRLRNAEGRPVQITIAKLARDLGQLALLQKHLKRLPKTARVLAKLVDTRESFAIRRVIYISELYGREGTVPKRWQLIRRSGLRPTVAANPTVQDAINAAMSALSAMSSLHLGKHSEVA